MRGTGSLATVLAMFAAGLPSARAQQSTVRLTTDQVVYKKDSPKGVTIALKNEGVGPVAIAGYGHWSVWKDGHEHAESDRRVSVAVCDGEGFGREVLRH